MAQKFMTESALSKASKKNVVILCIAGNRKKDGDLVLNTTSQVKQLANTLTQLPKFLGSVVEEKGLHCFEFQAFGYTFIAFPHKYNTWEEPNNDLIRQSLVELEELLKKHVDKEVYMEYPFTIGFDEYVTVKLELMGVTLCI